MANVNTTPDTPPRRRRWFQFSLRTLLVLMLLFGCVFAWVGLKVQLAVEQREAVKAIRKSGGSVVFAPPTSFVQRSAWLRELVGDEALLDVTYVILFSNQESNAALVHLRGLPQLRGLHLNGTQVTDAGLEQLRGLTQLNWLVLNGTQVTDARVDELRKSLPGTDIHH